MLVTCFFERTIIFSNKKFLKNSFIYLTLIFKAFSIFATTDQNGQGGEKLDTQKSNLKEGKNILKGSAEAEKTLKIGNLAFPTSQQPNPLISFGQNVLEKKQAQAQVLTTYLKGNDQYFINIIPSLLYGFTDSLSLFLVAPVAARYRQEDKHSSGGEDAIIQLEYAFYTKAHRTYYDQATVVANVTIPTGSTKKDPPTGIGANSFFMGGTFSRMEINWFYFLSSGGVITTSSHRTKFGNQFLYQIGFGRRITSTAEWLFDWMIEFDGIYSGKDKIKGKTNPDSGGNIVYLTPSLFISSKESYYFQFGVGVPISQSLFGHQNKNEYLLLLNNGWTF